MRIRFERGEFYFILLGKSMIFNTSTQILVNVIYKKKKYKQISFKILVRRGH